VGEASGDEIADFLRLVLVGFDGDVLIGLPNKDLASESEEAFGLDLKL
jgi:hypothetical protein